MGESAVMRLGGIDDVRNGPTTRLGIILIKSMLFSSANFHAACSASVLDTKYIWSHQETDKLIESVTGYRNVRETKETELVINGTNVTLTHPVILTDRTKSKSLQEVSS